MGTTYRIEQWSRDGQILRAEYVDEGGRPYTLRTVLRVVDELREAYAYSGDEELGKLEMRVVNNRTNQPVDEEYERQPWWRRPNGKEATSPGEAAQMLAELAQALRAGGDQPTPQLQLRVCLEPAYSGADRDDVRRGHAELLAKLLGRDLTRRGRTYETEGTGAYVITWADPPVEPEPVDEPDYPTDAAVQLVDREDPETGEPIPDQIEGHPVGRVVEQTARAILDPNSLPGDDGSLDAAVAQEEERQARQLAAEEESCCVGCAQPWALLISGHAQHRDGCPDYTGGVA